VESCAEIYECEYECPKIIQSKIVYLTTTIPELRLIYKNKTIPNVAECEIFYELGRCIKGKGDGMHCLKENPIDINSFKKCLDSYKVGWFSI